jgi:L-ascorbate metabolism protein UlaG (beta-lactamase superfamily)
MGKLQATLISNAGILLEYENTKILVDAIYDDEGHDFSGIPHKTWEMMLSGQDPFQSIDYLLFTHNHPDHFSERRLKEFLMNRKVKGVFLPEEAVDGNELSSFLEERNVPAVILGSQTDHQVFSLDSGLELQTVRMQHLKPLEKKYRDVSNFCYLLKLEQMKVLITADVDYVHHDFREIPQEWDVVFLNPYFFGEMEYRHFYHGALRSKAFAVYHVPFRGDDRMNMRHMLQQRLERWNEDGGIVKAFTEPMQTEWFV